MVTENIRKLCEERNISVWALEKEVGLGNGTVGKWRNTSPRVDRLQLVANYFGVTVDELLQDRQDSA